MSIKKLILSLAYYCLSAFGVSLTIKAGIGVSSLNSLNVALSEGLGTKVGTITIFVNGGFLIFCLLVDQKKMIREYVLMLFCLLGFGVVINFFTYTVLSDVQITSYPVAVFVFILGTVFGGYGAGRILAYGILQFPIEKACQLLEDITNYSFSFYRYGVDIISVILSIMLSILLQLPLFVREGTLISLFLLSFVIVRAKNGGLFSKLKLI